MLRLCLFSLFNNNGLIKQILEDEKIFVDLPSLGRLEIKIIIEGSTQPEIKFSG